CYQGAVVAHPDTGEFLRHVPVPLELARETIAAVDAEGFPLNVYVDDELYVARETAESEAYARFQKLAVHPVGDLLAWLDKPPTRSPSQTRIRRCSPSPTTSAPRSRRKALLR